MEDPPLRNPNPQTGAAVRICEVRARNLTDQDGATVLHTLDPTAVNEGAAAWGPGIRTLGYDRLALMLTFIKGAATVFHVVAQVGQRIDGPWHDLVYDQLGDGVLVRRDIARTIAADGAIAWDEPSVGSYMRFKVWAVNADASTNHTLRVMRAMNSL